MTGGHSAALGVLSLLEVLLLICLYFSFSKIYFLQCYIPTFSQVKDWNASSPHWRQHSVCLWGEYFNVYVCLYFVCAEWRLCFEATDLSPSHVWTAPSTLICITHPGYNCVCVCVLWFMSKHLKGCVHICPCVFVPLHLCYCVPPSVDVHNVCVWMCVWVWVCVCLLPLENVNAYAVVFVRSLNWHLYKYRNPDDPWSNYKTSRFCSVATVIITFTFFSQGSW